MRHQLHGWRASLWILVVAGCVAVTACSNPEVRKQEYYKRASDLAAQKNYAEAIIEYRNALKQDARFGEARLGLADASAATGDGRTAAREYLRAAELLPNSAEAQLKAAVVLARQGEFERARDRARAALKNDPGNVEAQIILANALVGLKEPDAAMQQIEEAIQMAPGDPRGYTSMGNFEALQGRKEEAEIAYKRAIAADPKAVTPHVSLAYFYWNDGRVKEVEPELETALALAPDDLLANRMLALFYLTQQRVKEAEGPLRTLVTANDPGATMTLGDLYVATGREDQARPLYDGLSKQRGTRSLAVARLASLDYAKGRTAEAHAAVDDALKAMPNDVSLLTLKSRWLTSEHRLDEALAAAEKAVSVSATDAGAQYALGLAHAARSELEPAVKAFNETLRLNPKAVAAQVALSRLSLSQGDTTTALAHAEAARQEQPNSLETRIGLARALLAKRDFVRAERELRPLLTVAPQSAEVHALYGTLLGARRDTTGAVRELDKALQLDPTNAVALTNRVTLDLAAHKLDDGRGRIATALRKSPADANLLGIAGRFEALAGDQARAEQYFRQSIEADPTNVDGYSALGQLYLAQKKLDAARAEFERLAARRPDAVAAKTLVGMIFELQNKQDDAVKVYEDVVGASQAAGVASNNLAYIYAERGEKLDRALDLAQRAPTVIPNRAEVNDTLGWVYYKRDLPALAIPPLEASVEQAPGNAMFHYHLGLAYEKAGRSADARKSFETALKLQPNFEGAEDARASISRGKS